MKHFHVTLGEREDPNIAGSGCTANDEPFEKLEAANQRMATLVHRVTRDLGIAMTLACTSHDGTWGYESVDTQRAIFLVLTECEEHLCAPAIHRGPCP